jgi:hypothetical protein
LALDIETFDGLARSTNLRHGRVPLRMAVRWAAQTRASPSPTWGLGLCPCRLGLRLRGGGMHSTRSWEHNNQTAKSGGSGVGGSGGGSGGESDGCSGSGGGSGSATAAAAAWAGAAAVVASVAAAAAAAAQWWWHRQRSGGSSGRRGQHAPAR